MNVVICDDERSCIDQVKRCVETWSMQYHHTDAVMIHSFQSSEDLYEQYEKGLSIDMLFLDIQIPSEMSGMDVAKLIHEQNEYIPIAFITNYSEYACDGYYVNALRYIIKPIQQKVIDECLDIAWNRWVLAQSESISIQMGKQAILLPIRDIIWVEASAHFIKIEAVGIAPLEVRAKLSDYYSMLPHGMFAQCHRGFIVNIKYVRRIQPNQITLAGGKVIPVGRKYAAGFFELFNQYNQGRWEN